MYIVDVYTRIFIDALALRLGCQISADAAVPGLITQKRQVKNEQQSSFSKHNATRGKNYSLQLRPEHSPYSAAGWMALS